MKIPQNIKTFFKTLQKTGSIPPLPGIDLLFLADLHDPQPATLEDMELMKRAWGQAGVATVMLMAVLPDGATVRALVQIDGLVIVPPFLKEFTPDRAVPALEGSIVPA
jgi:hypothetical protein